MRRQIMKMQELVEQLQQIKKTHLKMGGESRVARQHERGKLDVRQRIALLFDPDTFVEYGLLATDRGEIPMDLQRPSPGDGAITGYGKIHGKMTACAAYDFTIFGGSIGQIGETKVSRIRDLALKNRIPMVWLVDSAGARIHSDSGLGSKDLSLFADTGYLFREEVTMSGVIPLVAAMVGPGAAGTAYIPGLADFVPMVKGNSSMAIGGPYLVKGVVGEDISEEDLGGADIHCKISGCADLSVSNDVECITAIRKYLSYFPSHCTEKPERLPSKPPLSQHAEKILDIIPENPRQAYDVKKILRAITDDSDFFEIKPDFAKNIVTALARIDGYSIGIIANNPMFYGGVLDNNSADKAARFINICDAFNIPLLFLQDVPGFMVGSKVEKEGIIRHGAKMLYAVSMATVPKLTVVLRKGYGAGYYVMCGRAYEPDLLITWPSAEIAVMGAEGMVSIAAHKALEHAENPTEMRKMLADQIRPYIDPYRVAALGFVDDIIDPRDTRNILSKALAMTRNKIVERPYRKREISPV